MTSAFKAATVFSPPCKLPFSFHALSSGRISAFIGIGPLVRCLSSFPPSYLRLSSWADPALAFAGEARRVAEGPSSAAHHQRSGGDAVPRIPPAAVHRER